MKNLSLIVAIGKNNELGKDNSLIWHLPGDLKFFKEMTTGKTIIMGRKTFESLPKMLPNRKHIIITLNDSYQVEDAIILHNIESVLDYVKNANEECFVIGGASIYKSLIDYCDTLYITEIDEEYLDADAYFTKFDYTLYDKQLIQTKEENNIKYKHLKYTKK